MRLHALTHDALNSPPSVREELFKDIKPVLSALVSNSVNLLSQCVGALPPSARASVGAVEALIQTDAPTPETEWIAPFNRDFILFVRDIGEIVSPPVALGYLRHYFDVFLPSPSASGTDAVMRLRLDAVDLVTEPRFLIMMTPLGRVSVKGDLKAIERTFYEAFYLFLRPLSELSVALALPGASSDTRLKFTNLFVRFLSRLDCEAHLQVCSPFSPICSLADARTKAAH